MTSNRQTDDPKGPEGTGDSNFSSLAYRGVIIVVSIVMGIEFVLLLWEQQWFNAVILLAIMAVILSPVRLGPQIGVQIPPEFQILAIVFTFAALYLGEMRGFYTRLWWWDIALHTSSGLLLGILGFVLVYVLNENERVDLHMRPRFVALFAFLFALAVGTVWEMFEFLMDRLFGYNMQKSMLGDPSGLTDTMIDLMVDAAGALTICMIGWWHMKKKRVSFIQTMVGRFIARNPRLFWKSAEANKRKE
tara:strand:- start:334 stop:1074 length:741 start_codon:yes stop_codon:yes gene_type:complete